MASPSAMRKTAREPVSIPNKSRTGVVIGRMLGGILPAVPPRDGAAVGVTHRGQSCRPA